MSTSEVRPGRGHAILRLLHPFPSLLDGLVAGGVAVIAGAGPVVALRIGTAMFCLQAGIGTANDLVDAPADARLKPAKPIPLGLVSERMAERILAVALVIGLGLSGVSGLPTLALAMAGTAVGLAYDLRLKGTPWSWLPFAVGIPLLPLYGWVGANAGPVPSSVLVLLLAAVPAGAALAVANALGDLERDVAAGRSSVAFALGRRRSWVAGSALQAVVIAVAASAILGARPGGWVLLALGCGSGLIVGGLGLGRSTEPESRELGWELQAIGDAILAGAWLVALPA